MLRAVLRSESADLSDLGTLVDIGDSAAHSDESKQAAPEKPDSKTTKAGRIFPQRSLNFDRLNAFDAQVSLDLRKLKAAARPELESLKVTVNLQNGVLALKPMDLGLAGGHLAGSLTVDGRRRPASAQAKIDARDVRLKNCWPGG